ncbi:MAG: M16 family metallopeptidase [Bacteroidales bacterium]
MLPSSLPEIETQTFCLSNGVKLHAIKSGTPEVVRVSILFEAGTCLQPQKLVATATLALLSEGTKHFTAAQIAEQFDFLGSSYECSPEKDVVVLTVYSLKKHFAKTLQMLEEVMLNPIFSKKELGVYCTKREQQLRIEQERVAYLAQRDFAQVIYANSPYGIYADPEDFRQLNTQLLHDFYLQNYTANGCCAVLSGNVGEDEVALASALLQKIPTGTKKQQSKNFPSNYVPKNLAKPIVKAVQSAIRIGKPMMLQSDVNYAGMHILSVVLGGYFGSRLMRNLREDKGYTYGVFSGLISYRYAAHLTIGAEVRKDSVVNAVSEINAELQKLCSECIPEQEFELVQNYLCGELLRSLDGAWCLADTLLHNLTHNLPYSYPHHLFDTIKSITPKDLRVLAQQYLQSSEVSTVVVG